MTDFRKQIARTLVPRSIRNWLRSPAHSAAWVGDEIKYTLGLKQEIEVRPGWSVICHPAAYRLSYRNQIVDLDQVLEINRFIASCRPGMVVFDIGAHFGVFSLAALHYGGPEARAIAVDPSPMACRLLRIQAELNNVAGRMCVVEASVGNPTGWQDMIAVGVIAAGYYMAPTKSHTKRELVHCRAVTLDGLAEEHRTFPTHVKIDVEGFEAAVLMGGNRILSPTKAPILFIELHNQIVRDRGGNPRETLSLLRGKGYRLYSGDGRPLEDCEILKAPLVRISAGKTVD